MLSRGTTSVSFDYFKFELEFFAAHDVAEIELPELAGETEAGTSLIQIHNELNTQRAPEICQRNVGAHRFQPNFGIKSKDLSFLYKAIKRVAVEMIAMSRVRRPIDNPQAQLDSSAWWITSARKLVSFVVTYLAGAIGVWAAMKGDPCRPTLR